MICPCCKKLMSIHSWYGYRCYNCDHTNALLYKCTIRNHKDMQPEETLKLQKLVFDGAANLICEGVYLGSHLASMSELSLLKHLGITHILCVALETEYHPIHPLDIKYLHVNMYDSEKEDLLKHLPTSLNFMLSALSDNTDQKQSIDDVDIVTKTQKPHVLVVCRAGVSRSASVVIAWLMLSYQFSYQEAYKMTETSRPEICPNDGFVAQLKKFEILLKNHKEKPLTI